MAIFTILLLICFVVGGYYLYDSYRKTEDKWKKIGEYIMLLFLFVSCLLFLLGLNIYASDYTEAIDVADGGYTPFAHDHILTLIFYGCLSFLALLLLWLDGRKMPPLLFVMAIIMMILGCIISVYVIMQVSTNTEQADGWLFLYLPAYYLLQSFFISLKIAREEASLAENRRYTNRFLNYLNIVAARACRQPILILLFVIPLVLLITAVLVLFGQNVNSLVKVFTDTTTWHFSQRSHPPFLDHNGHYLCTVAACGDPSLVKPLRMGRRHGHKIIVNRQLQVANAFEELIQESCPALHIRIRKIYDNYGYPLSCRINTPMWSNITYLLMKPLEYVFLFVLYCCSSSPEDKIRKQYML